MTEPAFLIVLCFQRYVKTSNPFHFGIVDEDDDERSYTKIEGKAEKVIVVET